MKKLLGISIVAALAISPMFAMAAVTPDTGYGAMPETVTQADDADNYTTDATPMYRTVDATATADIASTSYVKGAYNAAIKAINKVSEQASADTTAIKRGIVSTINRSGTVVHTEWGNDAVLGYASDTVRAADVNNYNKYYPTYNGTAEALVPGQGDSWTVRPENGSNAATPVITVN